MPFGARSAADLLRRAYRTLCEQLALWASISGLTRDLLLHALFSVIGDS
jgi:hypothetical protein